jgi:putative ABC transport system substrate-binding protein
MRCIVILTLSLLVAPLATDAQQPAKIPRIGFLRGGRDGTGAALLTFEAFRQGLREHGYVEGQNIVIEYRSADARAERLPDLAADLVRLKVEVIVTSGPQPIRAVTQATTTIPIVMAISPDPVEAGLVASLARPGGNLTGLSVMAPEFQGKRLELLKEAVPGMARVAVLWNAASPDARWRAMEAAAQALGIALQSLAVRGPDDFDRAFDAALQEHADALYAMSDPLIGSHTTRIVAFAARHRLPTAFEHREDAEAGGLMAYGPSLLAMFRRAAAFVDKILKGAKPGELPIERPPRFELVLNLKTAKALGITIPPTLLFLADEVIR